MTSYFEAFGTLAEQLHDPTLLAGRHEAHAAAQQAIVADVVEKLMLTPSDTLFDIGCGAGALLIPLAEHVQHAWGLDHPAMIARLQEQQPPTNLTSIGADWLQYEPDRQFAKVLCYSVIHYFPTIDAVDQCIDQAVATLSPGGRLLVGDIPNRSAMERFRASRLFASVQQAYESYRQQQSGDGTDRDATWAGLTTTLSQPTISFDDAAIMRLVQRYRAMGCDAYIVPQAEGLPFCYSREDLLICKRP